MLRAKKCRYSCTQSKHRIWWTEWIVPRPGRYTPAQPWRRENLLSLPGIDTRFPGHPARSLVNIFTELSWLQQWLVLSYTLRCIRLVTQREWTETSSCESVSEPRIEIKSSKLRSRHPNHYNMTGSIIANLRVAQDSIQFVKWSKQIQVRIWTLKCLLLSFSEKKMAF